MSAQPFSPVLLALQMEEGATSQGMWVASKTGKVEKRILLLSLQKECRPVPPNTSILAQGDPLQSSEQ